MSEGYGKIVLSRKGIEVNKATIFILEVDGFEIPRNFENYVQANGYLRGLQSMRNIKQAKIYKKTYSY